MLYNIFMKKLTTKVEQVESTNTKILEILIGMVKVNIKPVVAGEEQNTNPQPKKHKSVFEDKSKFHGQAQWTTPSIQTKNTIESDNDFMNNVNDVSTIIVIDDENIPENHQNKSASHNRGISSTSTIVSCGLSDRGKEPMTYVDTVMDDIAFHRLVGSDFHQTSRNKV